MLYHLRDVFPGEIGVHLAADLMMLGSGVRPPRVARMIRETGATYATDAGTISTLTGLCGAAFYLAARNGAKDWLPAHHDIFPGDAHDRPDDRTRRDWVKAVDQKMLDAFTRAGAARRKIGRDGDIDAELQIVEAWAVQNIENGGTYNVSLFEFVKEQKASLNKK